MSQDVQTKKRTRIGISGRRYRGCRGLCVGVTATGEFRDTAKETQGDLNERGIYPIFWRAFSPDLNPIETVWDRMKDYIKRHYPEYHSSHDKLRRVVKEAWEAVRADELLALVREMPARCEAVIDAQGGYTKY
jgi:hypothetical protein